MGSREFKQNATEYCSDPLLMFNVIDEEVRTRADFIKPPFPLKLFYMLLAKSFYKLV